jgi:histone-lysine N-methyltransferase SETD2
MHASTNNVFQVAKKLVRGDYKHNKVRNPTAKLDSKHERTVKKFVKDFMDKAVQKKAIKEKEKAAKAETKAKAKADGKAVSETGTPETPKVKLDKADSDDDMLGLSDDEDMQFLAASPDESASELKRKREEEGDIGSPKKSRTETPLAPPPPPPPPIEDMPDDIEDARSTSVDDSFDTGVTGSIATDGEASLPSRSNLAEELVTDRVKQSSDAVKADSIASPVQLATPPTTNNGSCEHDSNTKDDGSEMGMNGERQPAMKLVNGS